MPSAATTAASASALWEGRHLVLQTFQIARDRRADHVWPSSQELAKLDVSRSQSLSAAASRLSPLFAPGRSRSRPRRWRLAGKGSGPRYQPVQTRLRAQTRSRRGRDEVDGDAASITSANLNVRDHAAGHGRERCPTKPGSLDHLREGFRLGKFPDRTRLGIGKPHGRRSRLRQRRNHLERIELVERIKAGNIDPRKFQAEESAAVFRTRWLRRAPRSMRGTLRMPNAMVTKSKLRSG